MDKKTKNKIKNKVRKQKAAFDALTAGRAAGEGELFVLVLNGNQYTRAVLQNKGLLEDVQGFSLTKDEAEKVDALQRVVESHGLDKDRVLKDLWSGQLTIAKLVQDFTSQSLLKEKIRGLSSFVSVMADSDLARGRISQETHDKVVASSRA